jgi:AcrR family transcriptional regulator
MKEKIIAKATQLFLKLGFKSVTMDDIANEMCISKKTIYKYFCNKELLIAETTDAITHTIYSTIDEIVAKKHNAIKENFTPDWLKNMKGKNEYEEVVYFLFKENPEIMLSSRDNL